MTDWIQTGIPLSISIQAVNFELEYSYMFKTIQYLHIIILNSDLFLHCYTYLLFYYHEMTCTLTEVLHFAYIGL